MILSKNQAKSLNMNNTIDLKYIIFREYCDSIELGNTKDKVVNYGYIAIHYIWMFTVAFIISFIMFLFFFTKSEANYIAPEYKYYWVDNEQDYQRKLRLKACTRVYEQNKDFIDNTFIHITQNPIIRCATMITLIWAYESDYFRSNMCVSQKNCFWIKSYTNWKFKTYDTWYKWYLDFARLYLVWNWNNTFKGHKNRNIVEFIENWSWDNIEVEKRYINFVTSKYWDIYISLKQL